MSDRAALFASLSAELGLGPTPQSLIGGALCDGAGDLIALEDPYARVTLTAYRDCAAALAEQAWPSSRASTRSLPAIS